MMCFIKRSERKEPFYSSCLHLPYAITSGTSHPSYLSQAFFSLRHSLLPLPMFWSAYHYFPFLPALLLMLLSSVYSSLILTPCPHHFGCLFSVISSLVTGFHKRPLSVRWIIPLSNFLCKLSFVCVFVSCY